VVWIIFIALSIETGGLLVNFFFHLFYPESISLLYQKLDLTVLRQQSGFTFYQAFSLVLIISTLKTYLFYSLTVLMQELNWAKPFNPKTSLRISQTSYFTFAIGLLSVLAASSNVEWLKNGYETTELSKYWNDGNAFLLMSAVVYVIAQLFKRGTDLQQENDLTV
jgi:hypothetical protein